MLDSLEVVVCKPVVEGVHSPGAGAVGYRTELVGGVVQVAREVLVELG